MIRLLQRGLLAAFRATSRTGLLATPLGGALFDTAYGLYKTRLEAPEFGALRAFVAPGTCVVDVGAGMGVFTRLFADWVGPRGRVVAFEPEPGNLATLARRLARAGAATRVEVIAGVAAEVDGELSLAINPDHPGDHHIAERGETIEAVRIDTALATLDWPEVSLVKIDVQGAEGRVIAGAEETLRRFRPALYVEVDDALLGRAGSSSRALVERLAALGYAPRTLGRAGPSPALDTGAALDLQARLGYVDFLFLPVTGAPPAAPRGQ